MGSGKSRSKSPNLVRERDATDIVFRDRSTLATLYEAISRTAMDAVKPEHVATFRGQRGYSVL